ncbi:MAG: hypothetical protein LBL24_01805 [Bacteroidales bacterium]|jgi:hypothetical protein|nr:hypothetical protein [Bacteroidales bacterium]
MTDKVAVTCLFPSCNTVENNAFSQKILAGLFGGVGYFANTHTHTHTHTIHNPSRPRLEKGAKKQIFYIPHIAMFRFFRDMAFFIPSPKERKERFTALPVRKRNHCKSIKHHTYFLKTLLPSWDH